MGRGFCLKTHYLAKFNVLLTDGNHVDVLKTCSCDMKMTCIDIVALWEIAIDGCLKWTSVLKASRTRRDNKDQHSKRSCVGLCPNTLRGVSRWPPGDGLIPDLPCVDIPRGLSRLPWLPADMTSAALWECCDTTIWLSIVAPTGSDTRNAALTRARRLWRTETVDRHHRDRGSELCWFDSLWELMTRLVDTFL